MKRLPDLTPEDGVNFSVAETKYQPNVFWKCEDVGWSFDKNWIYLAFCMSVHLRD